MSRKSKFCAALLVVLVVPFSNGFAQDACVVKGPTLQQAKTNYAAACSLPRVDCDPFNGEWYCASYRISTSTAPVVTNGAPPVVVEQTPVSLPSVSPPESESNTATPVVQPVSPAAPALPTCVSALSDSDGDGYGWENNESCLVTAESSTAAINTGSSTTANNTQSGGGSAATENTTTSSNNSATNQAASVQSNRFVSSGSGRWGNPISLPSIPVSAANLPDGKILTWAAYNKFLYTYGADFGRTYTTIFDPATGNSNESLVSNIEHDMFCPGASMLADGSIMVTGGSSVARTSVFNPASGSWSREDQLNVPRAYNSNTTLADGSVMTLGGSWAQEPQCRGTTSSGGGCPDKIAEIWDPVTGWRTLPGISSDVLRTNDSDGLFRSDNHMWLFAVSGGLVLHAGPARRMHLLNTSGNGSVRSVGNRGNDNDAMNGIAVMYDVGKLLTAGGAPDYENANASNRATIIEVNGSNVSSRQTDSMAFNRAYHNSVVLPNGEVIIAGGQAYPVPFTESTSVFAAELWNPVNETFRTLATMSTPRNYHSISLLLQDGRVLVGGGGLCGDCDANHADVEIFTPPYLLDNNGNLKNRPRILSVPGSASYGTSIDVQTNQSIASFALVRMAAVTHSVNNDQRRVPLAFSSAGSNNYRVSIPGDRGVAPPGNYFLFALDQSGTPSVASVVNIR